MITRNGWIGVRLTNNRGVGWFRIDRIVAITDRGQGDGANIDYEAGGEVWQAETTMQADHLIELVAPSKTPAPRKPREATKPREAARPRDQAR